MLRRDPITGTPAQSHPRRLDTAIPDINTLNRRALICTLTRRGSLVSTWVSTPSSTGPVVAGLIHPCDGRTRSLVSFFFFPSSYTHSRRRWLEILSRHVFISLHLWARFLFRCSIMPFGMTHTRSYCTAGNTGRRSWSNCFFFTFIFFSFFLILGSRFSCFPTADIAERGLGQGYERRHDVHRRSFRTHIPLVICHLARGIPFTHSDAPRTSRHA